MTWSGSAAFYQQLATLLQSGLPMPTAIELAGRTANGPHRARAAAWAAGTAGGRPLSELVAADGEGVLTTALVRAGESSGRLPEHCARIAAHFTHLVALRRLVIGRMIYPVVLLHVALVVPAIPRVFTGAWPAWSLLAGPLALWALLGAIAISAAIGGRSGMAASLALAWPFRGLAWPLITANTCQVLGAGLGAGMLAPQAVDLAAGACGNRIVGERLRVAAGDLATGRLANLTEMAASLDFPVTEVQLIANGETAGRVDQALAQCATVGWERFRERSEWTARVVSGVVYGLVMLYAAWTVVTMYTQLYLGPIRELSGDLDG